MNDDDALLLADAERGDQHAWDTLVGRYNGLLWSIARGYRLGTSDSSDAVQNTWLRLVENLDRISEPDRLGSWLATTVRRECLQVLRRTAREQPAATVDWLTEQPNGAAPLDAAMLLDERDAALWRALGSLSERCQRLLRVLMASPPPSYADVAAALDMPIGSIGSTRQRCLDRLRKVVSPDGLLVERAPSWEES